MSGNFFGSEDAESSDPRDPFAPESVDEAIAGWLVGTEGESGGFGDSDEDAARLVAALAGAYTLPAGAEAALARVRSRVRQAAAGYDGRAWDGESDGEDETEHEAPVTLTWLDGRERRSSRRQGAALRAIAAVLVVALLGGGFFALLRGQSGAGRGSAGVWADVSIMRAHLAAPLKFAPAHGLRYAVAETGGTIYACDANSLWYSVDNGRSYAPFPLVYPVSDTSRPNELCNMESAPGAPGIFVVAYGKQTQVEYAEAGDHGWRTLGIPATVLDVVTGERAAPLDASALVQAVSVNPDHAWLRVLGNWVFVLAQAPNVRLVGTPDFGATWYQLDMGLEARNLVCAGFTVSPVTPNRIFCGTESAKETPAGGNTSGIWQTFDGGKQWEQLPMPGAPRIGWLQAGGAYLYSTVNGTAGATDLWRYPLAGSVWQRVTTLPNWSVGGGVSAAPGNSWEQNYDLTRNGTMYEWLAAPDGGIVTTLVYMLAPGGASFTEVGAPPAVTFTGKSAILELGDTEAAGTPALYLHDAPTSASDASQPLFRLALPSSGAGQTQTDTTPLPVPATATATATPEAAGPCTTAPGNLADIQPGGFGATVDSFDARWGQHHGAAAGSIYFGPDASNGNWVVSAAEPASNGRVYQMSYRVDPAKTVTLAQAEGIAAAILPRDARQTVGPHATANGVEVDYCSAALIAAFPPGVQLSIAPLFHDGRIVVLYTVDGAGDVQGISFMEHVF